MNQKRIGALIIALFLGVIPAFAQGTIMPPPIFTGLDASGNPISSGKLCTYVAGTSTPATTYTTSALTVANANPVILSAAGRATVFLRPGQSYKFALYTAGSDTTCNTGTLQWSQDNITAVPSSSVNIDIDGTAGESLAAGDVVYLSDGQGSLTAGRWYKADADFTYRSNEAPFLGMVPNAISASASGTIRLKGLVTVTGPLTEGVIYYVSSTAGAATSTAPAYGRNVGTGYTSTQMLLAPINTLPSTLNALNVLNTVQIATIANGRCSLTSGTPVTTADVTAATTVYWTLYQGNQIGLFTGTYWRQYTFAELSVAVPATTNTMYDLFVDWNDGTPVLSATAWTNDTTRATALTTQNGIYVKTGDTQQRYVCSFRTTGVSGQTEDSIAKRYLWNYYNRVLREMRVLEATNSWTYSTNTWRQANGAATNQLDFIVGVAEDTIEAEILVTAVSNGTTELTVAIGVDSTTTPSTISLRATVQPETVVGVPIGASLRTVSAIGRHTWVWLEICNCGASTATWYGDNGSTVLVSGIVGWIRG